MDKLYCNCGNPKTLRLCPRWFLMLDFKIFVLNGLAGPYRKFLGMAVKKFGNFTRPNLQSIYPMYFYNQRSISQQNAFKDNPVAFLSIFALEQTRYCMLYIINFYTSLFNPFMMIRKEGEKEQLWNVVVFTFCCLCFDILLPFSIQPHPPPHNHK